MNPLKKLINCKQQRGLCDTCPAAWMESMLREGVLDYS